MNRAKTFNIPRRRDQSTRGARDAYFAEWGRAWPHDDDFLRELASDEDRVRKCTDLILVMREHHLLEETS